MGDNPAVSPLSLLPEEIWELVFDNLTQNEVLKARLVCKQWKEEIDSHWCGFMVRLDEEECPVLEQILRLRISECTVSRFMNPSPVDAEKIFRRPDLIKELSVDFSTTTTRSTTGRREIISPQNLNFLLKSCSTNLEYLALFLTETVLNNPCYSTTDEIGYTFPNLQQLFISITYPVVEPQEPPVENIQVQLSKENLFHGIITSAMVKIDSIILFVELPLSTNSAAALSFELLSFISKHKHGELLKCIVVSFAFMTNESSETEDDVTPPSFDQIDLTLLKKTHSLENISIFESPNRAWDSQTAITLRNTWNFLLDHQQKLELLYTQNLPISSSCLRNVCLNSSETIVKIKIDSLYVPHGVQKRLFDMTAFQNCPNLKDLRLKSYEIEYPELQNLAKLPTNLDLLDLSDFSIRSDDLLEFTQGHRMLSIISITDCWYEEDGFDHGVNGTVLEELMIQQNVNLKCIQIHSLNSTSPGELVKLNTITAALGYPEIDDFELFELDIMRNPIDSPWSLIIPLPEDIGVVMEE